MKQPRPLRIGSFERLESRALLAHAGLPPGMYREMNGDRSVAEHSRAEPSRGPGMEMRAPRGDVRGPSPIYSFSSEAPTLVIVPVIPVILIITLPPPTVPTPPAVSTITASTVSDSAPTSLVSSLTSSSSNRASALSAPAPSAIVERTVSPTAQRSSLSLLSTFATLFTDQETAKADEALPESPTAEESRDETRLQRDDETQLPQRAAVATEPLQKVNETDDDDGLIELDPEELRKRAKRRLPLSVVISNNEGPATRMPSLTAENRVLRVAELLPAESEEPATAVASDDLIELLAADHVEHPLVTTRVTPFISTIHLPLAASLGFHQASETAESSEQTQEQVPATVAAAALPAEPAQ